MTTKRNNLFFDRGESFMIEWVLKIADTVDNLEDLKDRLKDIRNAKFEYISECVPGFSYPVIEGCAIISHHYYITVKDDKYVIINCPKQHKIDTIILWSNDTNTQCSIDIYGDDQVSKFISNDKNYIKHIATLIGIANDWEITNKLKSVYIDDSRYGI